MRLHFSPRSAALPTLCAACILVFGAACRPRTGPPAIASHIFVNGTVLTLDDEGALPEALAIGDGRIVGMGSRTEIESLRGAGTEVVDLEGRTVAPAFVDHHVHLLNLGLSLLWAIEPPPDFLDLSTLDTKAAIAESVRQRAAALPAGSWILGKGWSQGAWGSGELPTHELLSAAAPRHPVFMTRVDAHAGWLNAEALARGGITATSRVPAGGAVLRLADGSPSGVLLERANEALRPFLPSPGSAQIKRAFRLAAEELVAQGVTEVFDAGFLGPPGIVDLSLDMERYLDLLTEADQESPLPLRINLMVPAPSALATRLVAGELADRLPTSRIRFTHLKLFVDGALGSRGAFLTHAYADDPSTAGVERMSHEELLRYSLQALDADLDVATHAIGDAAVARALDVYQEILSERPDLPATRLRIEHFSYASDDDFRRAGELGIVLSVNPDFVAPDDTGRAMEDARVGRPQSARVYAFNTLETFGGNLAFGSDYFTTPLPPLTTFYGAVTRKNSTGLPTEGWHPQEILPRREALTILTSLFPAGGTGRERGGLEIGGIADLVVLSADPLVADEADLLSIEVDATYAAIPGVGAMAHERRLPAVRPASGS